MYLRIIDTYTILLNYQYIKIFRYLSCTHFVLKPHIKTPQTLIFKGFVALFCLLQLFSLYFVTIFIYFVLTLYYTDCDFWCLYFFFYRFFVLKLYSVKYYTMSYSYIYLYLNTCCIFQRLQYTHPKKLYTKFFYFLNSCLSQPSIHPSIYSK